MSQPLTTGSPDRRTARWAGQRAKRRTEFIDGTIAAIAEYGPSVSTEQIAEHVGVARPQLYRHFDDTDDLHRAVARRAAALIVAEMAPVLADLDRAPGRTVDLAVSTLVGWIAEHANLYRYVTQQAIAGQDDVVADVKTTLGAQLSALLTLYLTTFDADPRIADPVAFGLVGFVESATDRWLTEPGTLSRDDLIGYLSHWVWGTLDHAFRAIGVVVSADLPLSEQAPRG